MQSGYSRQAETEADEFAAKILKRSAIDTRPLAGFFERIISQRKIKLEKEKKSKNKDAKEKPKDKKINDTADGRSLIEWISSHPATSKRIEFFNQTKQPTSPEILTPDEWQALKNICGKKEEKEKQKDKKPTE